MHAWYLFQLVFAGLSIEIWGEAGFF